MAALPALILSLAAAEARAAAPVPPTIPVYVGTALVTSVACAGSTDTVGTAYGIVYRDSTTAIDFGLFSQTAALGFVSTSATQGEIVEITTQSGSFIGPATYSGFVFTPLGTSEAEMRITIMDPSGCTESYRAVLALTSVTP
jgi:hypothetical protein